MLPRKHRATRAEIEQTIKNGATASGDFFYAKMSREKENPKFAVVISKKIEKTAAGRHLLKRRINSVIEREILKGKGKKIVVFFPKKINKRINYKEIEKDISAVLNKAHL